MFLNRRSFLHTATGLVTAPMVLPLTNSRPQSAESPLKLGLVTYNWGKDWPLNTLLSNCEATGFDGVELRSTHKHGVEITMSRKQRETARRQLADSPVKLVGLGSACEFHAEDPAVVRRNIEQTRQFVQLCHELGGTGVKVRPNGLPKGVPVEKTLVQIGRALKEVGQFAADFDVAIRLEVHGRGTSELPNIRTILDVADQKNVVVCWNCNPTDLTGDGLEQNFRLVRNRLGILHIHDLRNDKYPWKELFTLLKTTRFEGWTLLEEGRVPTDILSAMRENRRIWEQLVAT